jgi:hypothetical protein
MQGMITPSSDDRCLYGTVTGVGGMFQNPFLRPGTPQRSLYGRYVRLFVIFETPRPRLRENPIFGVNATHGGVKIPGHNAAAKAPNRPANHQA